MGGSGFFIVTVTELTSWASSTAEAISPARLSRRLCGGPSTMLLTSR